MKKKIIFATVVALSSAAFANGTEDFNRDFGLTALNAKTVNTIAVAVPTIKIDAESSDKINKITFFEWLGSYKPQYFQQTGPNSDYFCGDASGIGGYNKVTADELQADHQKGECAGLMSADLKNVNLRAANLRGAYMQGADLRGTELTNSIMNGAVLTGANLTEATMQATNLTMTDLTGANLNRAKLKLARFHGANLSKATLIEADLRGADLTRPLNLEMADLSGAKYNDDTKLPWQGAERDAKAKELGMLKVN
ncbi:MAG TPA: hypothetical protein DCS63_08170 [Elusimicrobia bacterium]|nr:hypothetical protein [Elusimicrobiota bacterium]